MYLLIFADKTVKQIADNLTIADILAIKQGTLTVLRFYNDNFQKLKIKSDKLVWTNLPQASRLGCVDGMIDVKQKLF